jgi:hypothetical protein
LACHFTSGRLGPITSIPRGFLETRMGAGIEPESSTCCPLVSLACLQLSLDGFRHHLIGGRSRGRGHMRDEMGTILIAGLGQMQDVTRPPRLALFA